MPRGDRADASSRESRESIAEGLGVRPNDVVFTSGGTEADNLAIKGFVLVSDFRRPRSPHTRRVRDRTPRCPRRRGWLVEHEVRGSFGFRPTAMARLTVSGCATTWRRMHTKWRSARSCGPTMRPERSSPLSRSQRSAHSMGSRFTVTEFRLRPGSPRVMCGALRAPRWRSLLTKVRRTGRRWRAHCQRCYPQPLLHGGGQEIDIRSGTVATALIASAAAAFSEAIAQRDVEAAHCLALTEQLVSGVMAISPDATLVAEASPRLPTIGAISFPGCQADALLLLLDAVGVSCSAGSACTAGVPRPSHVLLAMGVPADQAQSTLRFSVGWNSQRGGHRRSRGRASCSVGKGPPRWPRLGTCGVRVMSR